MTAAYESVGRRSAVLEHQRPPQAGTVSECLTFAWRAILKIRHVPEQLIEVVATPIIFTLMFTYLFGGALSGSTDDYLQFLLPGTLVMTVLLLTTYTGVGVNTDLTSGLTDRFRSLPIWQPAPIVGALIGDIGRYLSASFLLLALGFALGFHASGGVTGVILSLALILTFASSLSWIWTSLGMVARSPNSIMNAGMVVLFPLTLASNVFVDPKTTPGWLEAFIKVNPVSHLVTATRGLLYGHPAPAEITWVLIASAALVLVFAPLTMWLYASHR